MARSGDFFVGVLYWVGVGLDLDLPRQESPAQIGRVGNYAVPCASLWYCAPFLEF